MPEKCNCCVGSSCEPADPGTCGELSGECKRGNEGCFVTRLMDRVLDSIGDSVLARLIAGGTYSRVKDFRDRILVNSRVGRRALSYNRRFDKEMMSILHADPELFVDLGRIFFVAARYSRTLLRCADGYGDADSMAITPEMFESASLVGARVAESASDELRTAIKEILSEIEPLISLTPSEVLRALEWQPLNNHVGGCSCND